MAPSLGLSAALLLHALLLALPCPRPASAAAGECNINDLVPARVQGNDIFAPDCAILTANGSVCSTTALACEDPAMVMVRQHVCLDGEWHWPPQPQFCDHWNGCVFDWPHTLTCAGPFNYGAGGRTPTKLPRRLDPRLKSVTVTNVGMTGTRPLTLILPQLEHLNLSFNAITALPPFELQQPTLRSIDLSFNQITEVYGTSLPMGRILKSLNLQGNDIQRYSSTAIDGAIGSCTTEIGRESDLTFNVPHCKLSTSLETAGGTLQQCVLPKCSNVYQGRQVLDCETLSSGVGSKSYSVSERCDETLDCFDGSDERRCAGFLQLRSAVSPVFDNGLCSDILPDFFQRTYAISGGLVRVPLARSGVISLGFAELVFPIVPGDEPPLSVDASSSLISSATLEAAFEEDSIVFDVLYTLAGSSGEPPVRCRVEFWTRENDTFPTSRMTTEPGVAPQEEPSASASLGASVGAAVGAVAAVVCIGVVVFVLYSRRRTQQKADERLSILAPPTPRHLILAVC